MGPLAKRNALSQKDLDDATSQQQSAQAAVLQAKAQVEQAQLDLSYATVVSPVTGITGAAMQADGTYISDQNNLLTTVAVLTPMWVNFSMSENQFQRLGEDVRKGLLKVPPGQNYTVEIVLVDGTVFPQTGRVTFTDPYYNPNTGTFLVRVSVNNPEGRLRPEPVRTRTRTGSNPGKCDPGAAAGRTAGLQGRVRVGCRPG